MTAAAAEGKEYRAAAVRSFKATTVASYCRASKEVEGIAPARRGHVSNYNNTAASPAAVKMSEYIVG